MVSFVAGAGGAALHSTSSPLSPLSDVEPADRALPEWNAYRYFGRKLP